MVQKKIGGINSLLRVFSLLFFVTYSYGQTMSRQDQIFIKKGLDFGTWTRVDRSKEDFAIADRTSITNIGRTGRYIRIQIGSTDPLNLAEVRVFSGSTNVALGKTTSQSSNLTAGGGLSSLAIDGNTNGSFVGGSVTSTLDNNMAIEPWWQIDLGSIITIDSIQVWNRTDACCSERLKGFYLFVSNNPFTSNTLAGTLPQSGVSLYGEPGIDAFPSGAELSNFGFSPTYYELPMFNYIISQNNPNTQWSLAGYRFAGINGKDRTPSSFEQSNGFLNSLQTAKATNLRSISFGDEVTYSTAYVSNLTSWFNLTRSKYPDVLLHNNQYAGQWTDAQLRSYMQTAHPDLLTYDFYNFYQNASPSAGNSYGFILNGVQQYRRLALEGYDGTGNTPIAFGGYLQGYKGSRNGGSYNYYPSESEFNVGTYSFLLTGAKWLNIFRFIIGGALGAENAFFYKENGNLLPQYWQYANLAKEINNLSPHLSRLQTTDVRFIPGQHLANGVPVSNQVLADVPAWNSSADPYITAITATNLVSTTNDGLRGDVGIGYFKPVTGIDNTSGITMAPVPSKNTKYFMIMNGLVLSNGCCSNPNTDTLVGKAVNARQSIRLNIDFGSGPVDTLYRVKRSDGTVEQLSLTQVSSFTYFYDVVLEGGKADLFYWKNAGNPTTSPTKAVSLSSSYISAGDVTQLKNTAAFTLESWVKFNSASNWATVLAKSTSGTDRIAIQTGPGDNSLYVMVGNGSNSYGFTAANAVSPGQWYHVAAVFDGTQTGNAARLKLYLNGIQQTLTFSGTIPATTSSTNSAAFLAGTEAIGSPAVLPGTIDEVRVWNTAISQANITAWKDKALGSCHPNAGNLALYWQLDDATNPGIAVASLGASYTGTLSSGGTYIASTQATGASGCGTACNAPVGLSSSAITTTGATLSWTAVSGALNYTVEYKATASSTWITAAAGATSTSVTLTSLSASTTYDWRVRTNCSGSSSANTAAQFTTLSGTNAVTLSSGYMSAGDVTQLKGASAFTLESWVNFTSTGNWATVMAKSTAGTNRIALQTGPGDNSLYVMVGNGSNSYGFTAPNVITTGQWYHLAVVFDGTQTTNATRLKLYLNGVQQTLTFSGTIPATSSTTNTAAFLAGTEAVGSAVFLAGTIDEVRVWNAALSQITISGWKDKALGNCHPNSANIVLYWQLDNASSNTVAVASPTTSYTGTIVNGTYVSSTQATGTSGCAAPLVAIPVFQALTDQVDKQSGIAPNPINNYLKIQSNIPIRSIKILSQSGQVIISKMGSGQTQLVVVTNRLPVGVYMVQVITAEGKTKMYKVIKQ